MPWGRFTRATRSTLGPISAAAARPVDQRRIRHKSVRRLQHGGQRRRVDSQRSSDGFLATGGSWNDPTYLFAQFGGGPVFSVSNTLGFRWRVCERAPVDDSGIRIAPTEEIPDHQGSSESDVRDDGGRYNYEKTALDARVEETVDTPEWKREKITYNGAERRASDCLFVSTKPRRAAASGHPLMFLPRTLTSGFRSVTESLEDRMTPFVKGGRAVFAVVLKGYIERLLPAGQVPPDPTTVEYTGKIVNRVTDLRRGLDYLETRHDLDSTRRAFVGPSAGAADRAHSGRR